MENCTFWNFTEFKFSSTCFTLTQNILLLIVYLPCTTYPDRNSLSEEFMLMLFLIELQFHLYIKVYAFKNIYWLKVIVIARKKKNGELRKPQLDCEFVSASINIHTNYNACMYLYLCATKFHTLSNHSNPRIKKSGP